MRSTNVELSANELELMANIEVILAKNNIIKQIGHLFACLAEAYVKQISHSTTLPIEATSCTPKIAKGENYQGLPWLMMDYPRIFSKNHIFAIRTHFWWGHFFSITLQLSGMYHIQFSDIIFKNWELIANKGWYLCVNASMWEHHFEPNNYQPINEGTISYEQWQALPFIKLAKRISLNQYHRAEELMLSEFKTIIQLLEPR